MGAAWAGSPWYDGSRIVPGGENRGKRRASRREPVLERIDPDGAGYLLSSTKLGYELRAVGYNKDAARFSGINVNQSIVLCMLISGCICGLAGSLNITGISPHAITTLAAQEGYGFNGLSVAFIAGCSCAGCIPASVLFAGLIYGGMTVQQVMGAPSDIINIMIGTIVFFTALPGVTPLIADWLAKRREEKQAATAEAAGKEG